MRYSRYVYRICAADRFGARCTMRVSGGSIRFDVLAQSRQRTEDAGSTNYAVDQTHAVHCERKLSHRSSGSINGCPGARKGTERGFNAQPISPGYPFSLPLSGTCIVESRTAISIYLNTNVDHSERRNVPAWTASLTRVLSMNRYIQAQSGYVHCSSQMSALV